MKTNKKAILGMLVAMVMSLGVMNGINSGKTNDSSLQQVGVGCAYVAGETEGGVSNAWNAASNWCLTVSAGGAIAGLTGAAFSTTNPVGWGYWASVGVIAL
jgi:hypothetical protein